MDVARVPGGRPQRRGRPPGRAGEATSRSCSSAACCSRDGGAVDRDAVGLAPGRRRRRAAGRALRRHRRGAWTPASGGRRALDVRPRPAGEGRRARSSTRKTGEIAIEELHIAHEGLRLVSRRDASSRKATLQRARRRDGARRRPTGDAGRRAVQPGLAEAAADQQRRRRQAPRRPSAEQHHRRAVDTLIVRPVFDTADEGTTDAPRRRADAHRRSVAQFVLPEPRAGQGSRRRGCGSSGATFVFDGVIDAAAPRTSTSSPPTARRCGPSVAVTIKEQDPKFEANQPGPGAQRPDRRAPTPARRRPPRAAGPPAAPVDRAPRRRALGGESAADLAGRGAALDPARVAGARGRAWRRPARAAGRRCEVDFSAGPLGRGWRRRPAGAGIAAGAGVPPARARRAGLGAARGRRRRAARCAGAAAASPRRTPASRWPAAGGVAARREPPRRQAAARAAGRRPRDAARALGAPARRADVRRASPPRGERSTRCAAARRVGRGVARRARSAAATRAAAAARRPRAGGAPRCRRAARRPRRRRRGVRAVAGAAAAAAALRRSRR